MMASTWSAVSTRGLAMILPLPSASRALISRFRKRVSCVLKRMKENWPALKPFKPAARMLLESELPTTSGEERLPADGCRGGHLAGREAGRLQSPPARRARALGVRPPGGPRGVVADARAE